MNKRYHRIKELFALNPDDLNRKVASALGYVEAQHPLDGGTIWQKTGQSGGFFYQRYIPWFSGDYRTAYECYAAVSEGERERYVELIREAVALELDHLLEDIPEQIQRTVDTLDVVFASPAARSVAFLVLREGF